MPTPWFTLRKSDAPPRPPWRQIAAVTVMSIMALIVLAFIGEITGFALLTPPLAASMALIAGCPNLPLSPVGNYFPPLLAAQWVLSAIQYGRWPSQAASRLG